MPTSRDEPRSHDSACCSSPSSEEASRSVRLRPGTTRCMRSTRIANSSTTAASSATCACFGSSSTRAAALPKYSSDEPIIELLCESTSCSSVGPVLIFGSRLLSSRAISPAQLPAMVRMATRLFRRRVMAHCSCWPQACCKSMGTSSSRRDQISLRRGCRNSSMACVTADPCELGRLRRTPSATPRPSVCTRGSLTIRSALCTMRRCFWPRWAAKKLSASARSRACSRSPAAQKPEATALRKTSRSAPPSTPWPTRDKVSAAASCRAVPPIRAPQAGHAGASSAQGGAVGSSTAFCLAKCAAAAGSGSASTWRPSAATTAQTTSAMEAAANSDAQPRLCRLSERPKMPTRTLDTPHRIICGKDGGDG
mmetsp:Transcript_36103/g.93081  ORF Transcript_36103/g.93081 Transcript_36103/m.93081 type:complete len:367 (-) Transcript_36103:229-1329(-)